MRPNIAEPLAGAISALLSGDTPEARSGAQRVLQEQPDEPDALHLLALAEAKSGDYQESIRLLRKALSLKPEVTAWRVDLGIAYAAAHTWRCAAMEFTRVIEQDGRNTRALKGYGKVLLELGEAVNARSCFLRLDELQPGDPASVLGVARSYFHEKKTREAVEALQRALESLPDYIPYLSLLANIYAYCREYEAAKEAWERVLKLDPADVDARGCLALTCWMLNDLEDTLMHCRIIISAGQATPDLRAFYAYLILYSNRETPESIREACREFGQAITTSKPVRFNPGPCDVERKQLRVGYLCGEFMSGASFYFLSPLIGNHNCDAVSVYCYHTRQVFDDQTRWFVAHSQWRDCRGWDDDRIRRQIRGDQIDILVDLSGFYPENRLQMFAQRAAPVQATFPNCPVSTGVSTIDYIFTDRWTCPPELESQYVEQAVPLPSGYLVYGIPKDAPPLSPLPAEHNGHVTFGLFQRRAKMNAGVWDVIAEILRACSGSRLLIQHGDPKLDVAESRIRCELRREFQARGIGADRLEFAGACSHRETMAVMARADIALDTFPYQGQTTTCECLWMGVPVVALTGRAHVARVGTALLQRAGLPELAVDTPEEYVRTGLRLAEDRKMLLAMRSTLRGRLSASPVMDGAALARNVEAAYRWMWSRWCTGALTPVPRVEQGDE